MSVEIEPAELEFRRPFTVEVGQILKIKNINTAPVAFKVKTTAPKQYCVRPNSGRVEPGHEVEVTVLLQAMKSEPALDARCRDKFLVQSVAITGDKEFTNVQQIWDTVEKGAVQERKIRVTWLPALEEGLQAPATTPLRRSLANGEATPDTTLPAYSSPSENSNYAGTAAAAVEPEKREAKAGDDPARSTTSATAMAAANSASEFASDEDKIPAGSGHATSNLNQDTGGLRQRKTAGSSSDQPHSRHTVPELTQAVRQGTEGVPIHIVALLCLLSFLLAYFFF